MYYFIINPASGSGRGLKVWNTIEAELKHLKVEYRAFLLSRPGEATQLVSGFSSSKTPCTIVTVGGDGTINDVVNGLRSFEHITFACIPTGSGNDFVRGLGLERDPVASLHHILKPKEICPINIGTVRITEEDQTNTHSFAVSTGLGFDAAVCHSVEISKLKKFLNLFHAGKIVYLLIALWHLMTMKRNMLEITDEHGTVHTFRDTYFAAAMNLSYEGGGFYFCPDAIPDDDYFDLIVVDRINRLQALMLLPQALVGRHVGKKGITILRCQKAHLHNPSPLCVHTDGEVRGFHTTVDYEMRSEKLAVIIR